MSAGVLVELRGVSVWHGDDVALSGVDLAVAPGERLAILGPNGGGKSTLVRTVLGLVRPRSGSVVWPRPRRALRLGYVPQFPAFDRSFPIRVRDLIGHGRLRAASGDRRGGGGDEKAAIALWLERLGLGALADAYLTELSGGELKRALIARALVGEPELLVLDEATASLDESSRRSFWRLLAELPASTAILLATHDLAPATFVPTRALLVDRTVVDLPLDGLHTHPLLCGHGHD